MRDIFAKRYGKVLMAVIVVILGIFVMQTSSVVRSWHSNQEWLHSAKFKQDFLADPKGYGDYDYDELGRETFKEYTLEEYIEKESYLFANRQAVNAQGHFQNVEDSYTRTGDSAFYLATGLVALCGFLMFFIDQKTSFNRYLFSLAVSRKKLFWDKMRYLALPLVGAFVLGIGLMIVGFSFGIPKPYLNISLGQLMASGFLGTVTCIFFLAISCFMGSMLGNLVFGPLTYVIFMWSLYLLPNILSNIYELGYYLLHHQSIPDTSNSFYGNGRAHLYVFRLGTNPISWSVVVGMLLFSALLIFWAYRKYQTLSLEHDGEYLLHKESRWPVWLIATIYLTCFGIFGYTQIWSAYIYNQLYPNVGWDTSFKQAIFASVFWFVVAVVISTLLLFFGPIRKWLREKKEHRGQLLIRE